MNEKIDQTLYRVAEEVLEKLAFIFSFPADEEEIVDSDAVATVNVRFNGPFSGNLIMKVSNQALPELAENMLGLEDEETTEDQQYDALKELVNVICGNLLPAVAGKQEIFKVDMPNVIDAAAFENIASEREPISRAILALEEGQCELLLFVEGEFETIL